MLCIVSCVGRTCTVCLCLAVNSVQEMESVNEQQQEDLKATEVVCSVNCFLC